MALSVASGASVPSRRSPRRESTLYGSSRSPYIRWLTPRWSRLRRGANKTATNPAASSEMRKFPCDCTRREGANQQEPQAEDCSRTGQDPPVGLRDEVEVGDQQSHHQHDREREHRHRCRQQEAADKGYPVGTRCGEEHDRDGAERECGKWVPGASRTVAEDEKDP